MSVAAVTPEEACRIAAELADKYGELAFQVASRAVATYEAEGMEDRAQLWRTLRAILTDIAANRIDPNAPIAIH